MDRTKPYNKLPLISTLYIEPNENMLRMAGQTQADLAVLNYALARLPNDRLIIDNLLFQEAKCSSAIENIVTTNDELYKGLVLNELTLAAKEVRDYKEGLFLGYQLMQKKQNLISLSDLIAVNSVFNRREKGIRKNRDDFDALLTRIVALHKDGTKEILYTPPHGEQLLNSMLRDLMEFVYDDERYSLHPLIKIALAHYQFESIHPFYDGNGRTGRILNILLLCNKEYLAKPYLYASSFIVKNKVEYYQLLNETTTKNNYEKIIMYMLQSFGQTARETLKLVENIMELYGRYISQEFLASIQGNKENLRLAITKSFEKMYIRNKDLEDAGLHRQTAATILHRLTEAGLLQEETIGGNTHIYKNIELLKLFGGKDI